MQLVVFGVAHRQMEIMANGSDSGNKMNETVNPWKSVQGMTGKGLKKITQFLKGLKKSINLINIS